SHFKKLLWINYTHFCDDKFKFSFKNKIKLKIKQKIKINNDRNVPNNSKIIFFVSFPISLRTVSLVTQLYCAYKLKSIELLLLINFKMRIDRSLTRLCTNLKYRSSILQIDTSLSLS